MPSEWLHQHIKPISTLRSGPHAENEDLACEYSSWGKYGSSMAEGHVIEDNDHYHHDDAIVLTLSS